MFVVCSISSKIFWLHLFMLNSMKLCVQKFQFVSLKNSKIITWMNGSIKDQELEKKCVRQISKLLFPLIRFLIPPKEDSQCSFLSSLCYQQKILPSGGWANFKLSFIVIILRISCKVDLIVYSRFQRVSIGTNLCSTCMQMSERKMEISGCKYERGQFKLTSPSL